MDKKKQRKPRRTNQELNDTLFSALSEMLYKQKFRDIGINELSAFAQVEKNFIYNHFGDMDGLLREYVKQNDFWGKVLDKEAFASYTPKQMFGILLHGQFDAFWNHKDFQNIIRWEIASSNDYVSENAKQREADGEELIKHFAEEYKKKSNIDVQCLFALFSAGIYYLILHKNISNFAGIDFSDKNQALRILPVINRVMELYINNENKNKSE